MRRPAGEARRAKDGDDDDDGDVAVVFVARDAEEEEECRRGKTEAVAAEAT